MIDHNLKLLYLELLCKHKPDQVPSAVEMYSIPLEAGLEVCQKLGNTLGAALITGRLGQTEAAVRLFAKV